MRWAGIIGALVLQLLTSASSVSGFVLCMADDGHIALEAAHGDSECLGDYLRHHPADATSRDLEQHGCTDSTLTLPITATATSLRADVGHADRLLPIALDLPSPGLNRLPIRSDSNALLVTAQSARALSTIILLI